MNNNSFIYVVIVITLTILIVNINMGINGNLTNNQKRDLDKKVVQESNLPKIEFDKSVLENINSLKNIKSN